MGFSPQEVLVTNLSSIQNLGSAVTVPLTSWWCSGLPANSAYINQPAGTATPPAPQPQLGTYVSSNGILVSSTSQIAYAGTYTGTALTATNPATITGITPASGSAALVTGQTGILWLSVATGASQWANAFYNFTATSATAISLPGINNTFAAGTAATFTIVQNIGSQLLQTSQVITAISSPTSTTTLLTMSTNTGGFAVGNYLLPTIPVAYGSMAFALNYSNSKLVNNLGGYEITAVSGNTVTILAPTAGSTFSYPTNAVVQASLGKTYQKPVAVPAGVTPTIYNQAQQWTGSVYVTLGTSVCGLSGNQLWVSASTIAVQ
jgi:hypothetical protein